jgi:hypothetical protein
MACLRRIDGPSRRDGVALWKLTSDQQLIDISLVFEIISIAITAAAQRSIASYSRQKADDV